jgi:calcium/proton exchanger cax
VSNWLLIVVPVAIALGYLAPKSHLLVFVTAALAILPLAGWMGRVTEQLAERSGEGVGGLLNATLGNAALIIALAALRDVVKASIGAPSAATSSSCSVLRCSPAGCVTRNSTSTPRRARSRPPC